MQAKSRKQVLRPTENNEKNLGSGRDLLNCHPHTTQFGWEIGNPEVQSYWEMVFTYILCYQFIHYSSFLWIFLLPSFIWARTVKRQKGFFRVLIGQHKKLKIPCTKYPESPHFIILQISHKISVYVFIHLTRIYCFLASKPLLHSLENAGINRTIFMIFAIPTPKYKIMYQKQYL